MRNSKRILFIGYFLFIFGLSACYLEESRSSVPLPYEIFNINPTTIIEDISQHKEDIFVPLEKRIPGNEIVYIPVTWNQNDYIEIANSIHKFVWSESLDNWKVNSILFYLQCQEAPYGSQSAYLTYFKIIENATEEYHLVHNIVIQPQEKIIGVYAEKYSQITATWEEYKLSEFKVTSDDALQFAENIGGKRFREVNKNNCSISISLNRTYRNDKDWVVTYRTDSSNFEFIIDPITGDYLGNK